MTALVALREHGLRTTPWLALLLATAASALLIAGTWDALDTRAAAGWALRAVAVLLATAVALATDDPVADLAATSPLRLRLRRALLPAPALAWAVLAWGAAAAVLDARAPVPVAGLALEAAALVAVALAVAAVLTRRGQPWTAALVAPVPLLSVGLAVVVPDPWVRLLADTTGASGAVAVWAPVSAVAAIVLTVATRDPGSRPRRPRRPSRQGSAATAAIV